MKSLFSILLIFVALGVASHQAAAEQPEGIAKVVYTSDQPSSIPAIASLEEPSEVLFILFQDQLVLVAYVAEAGEAPKVPIQKVKPEQGYAPEIFKPPSTSVKCTFVTDNLHI